MTVYLQWNFDYFLQLKLILTRRAENFVTHVMTNKLGPRISSFQTEKCNKQLYI